MIKLPTKNKKTMKEDKIKIFDEDTSLSIIEENSHLYSRQSRYSKNELSSNSSVVISSKRNSHKRKNKMSKGTQSNKTSNKSNNKNNWGRETPSNTPKLFEQDTLRIADEIIERRKVRGEMENPQIPNSSRNNPPTTSVNLNSSISSRAENSPLVAAQEVVPAYIPSVDHRNVAHQSIFVNENLREIMGNSWIHNINNRPKPYLGITNEN